MGKVRDRGRSNCDSSSEGPVGLEVAESVSSAGTSPMPGVRAVCAMAGWAAGSLLRRQERQITPVSRITVPRAI